MDWRTKGRLAGVAVLFASFVSANAPTLAGPAVVGEPAVQNFARQTVLLQDAEIAARHQFEGFVGHVLEGGSGQEAAIKVAADGHSVWVRDVARKGHVFIGRSETGTLLTFSNDQVRDWSFIGKNGKLYGSYSTRALLVHLPEAQANQISAVLSDIPTAWTDTKIARIENFPLQQRHGTNK